MKRPFKKLQHSAKKFTDFSDSKNSVLGKSELRKLEDSDLTEDKFIDLNFQIEFNNLVLPLFIIIATFQMWAYFFVEYSLFGFQPTWLLIRLAYLPYMLIICKIWKLLWRDHSVLYLIPLIACYLYIYVSIVFSMVVTNESDVFYQLSILQLVFGLAFVPLRLGGLIVSVVATLIIMYSSWYYFRPGPNTIHTENLVNFALVYVLSFCLSIVIWRVRLSRAKLQYQLKQFIANQSETIRSQSHELARAKIYEAIAHTAQLVAHDVRKPFVMIKNGLAIIKKECRSEGSLLLFDALQKDLDKSLVKVNGTLKDIMYIGNKDSTAHLQKVDLKTLISEVVAEVKIASPDKLFTIATVDLTEGIFIDCNENKLNRVLFNILDNAVSAVSAHGYIEIKASSDADQINLAIKNNGKIIPPESLAKLFDPFFTEGKKSGTGLGLHITKLFLDELGASIDCQSEQGLGTVFTISFPRSRMG